MIGLGFLKILILPTQKMFRKNLKRERSETGYDYHWKYPALAT